MSAADMNSLGPPDGNWAGAAAFITSVGALIAASIRRGPKREEVYAVRNKIAETALRVAVLESRYTEIDRRLTRIETKLDQVIDRHT